MPAAHDASHPDFRATITRTRLTIVPWGRWLADSGPLAEFEEHVDDGIALADLGVVRDDRGLADEVVVEWLCGDGRGVRSTLIRWAATVGYRRIWLPDEMIQLTDAALVGGRARTRCRSCGGRLASGDTEFWVTVRCMGAFPPACPLCGGDLPQWTVRGGGRSTVTASGGARPSFPTRRAGNVPTVARSTLPTSLGP